MNALTPGARARTKQDWRTPPEFIAAVERRFGRIGFDLAATDGHEVGCGYAFTPEDDSLSCSWIDPGVRSGYVVWLNPPYANIRPWVAKLDAECRELDRWTLCLVPAAVGSRWYADHVHGRCLVLFLTGRLTFVGASAPYPKDCMLLCYGFGAEGVALWDWRAK